MTVTPGFDVGTHIHTNGEEMFDVVDGEIDVGRTPAGTEQTTAMPTG